MFQNIIFGIIKKKGITSMWELFLGGYKRYWKKSINVSNKLPILYEFLMESDLRYKDWNTLFTPKRSQ